MPSECLCLSNGEARLMKNITENYDPRVRPVLQQNDTVMVTLGMSLHQIIDLVGKDEISGLAID